MQNFVIAANISSILVCTVILYGTLFETQAGDYRKLSLSHIIGFQIFQNVFFIIKQYLTDDSPFWLSFLVYFVKYPCFFISLTLILYYWNRVLEAMDIDFRKPFSFLLGFCFLSFFIDTAVLTKNIAHDELWQTLIYSGLSGISYVIFLWINVKNAKKIGTREVFSFFAYLAIPFFSNLIFFRFPYSSDIPFFTLSIILIYIMLQSRLNKTTVQENALYFKSIAAGYVSMYILDFEKQTFKELGTSNEIRNYVDAHPDYNIQELIWGILSQRICAAHLESLKTFTDFSTLEERMSGLYRIEYEGINTDNHWIHFTFQRVGLETNKLTKVLIMANDIDPIKRKENELILMSNTDGLTNILNRHAYESDLNELAANPVSKNLWIINYDLNGLKIANDTKGHKAGDELIIAMTRCISKTTSHLGKVYRVGGDEFISILNGPKDIIEQAMVKLDKMAAQWHGTYSDSLSFSRGMVSGAEIESGSVMDMIKEADRRMYIQKEYHHKHNK